MTVERTLFAAAAAHLAAAVLASPLLLVPARAAYHEHPVAKPLRFALSIALFLGSLAVVTPLVALDRAWKDALAKLLVATMTVEMVLIAIQAARGRASHFNTSTGFDAAIWRGMVAAIVVATGIVIVLAAFATLRPLCDAAGVAIDPVLAASWRFALWCFLLVAVTGFRMGSAGRHSIGGGDGEAAMAVTGWSTRHGDLRVPHFFALHALQILPLLAALLRETSLGEGTRWMLLLVAMGAQAVVTIGTLLQATGGRPSW